MNSRNRVYLSPVAHVSHPRTVGSKVAIWVLLVAWYSFGVGLAEETATPTDESQSLEKAVHIVRRGESLREITTYYLASDDLWEENHKLNPQITNPNLIHPGQRITVLRKSTFGVPNAVLTQVAGQVEDRPMPRPWGKAQVLDLLLERDGIRTYADSSTRMKFPDGTSVLLTEDSLVYLRKTGAHLVQVKPNSVEIVEGQADIDAQLGPSASTEIEVLVGGALATLKMDPEGISQSRAKRVEGLADFVMVYEGAGVVEAGGESVAVERGMGTKLVENQPPTPPEALLPAPGIVLPAANTVFNFGNPGFEWVPVPEAASYTVELCRDELCASLVTREVGLSDSRWRSSEPLPVEPLYWRVTATSPSGLDGYPSKTNPFSVTSGRLDTTPPRGELQIVGQSLWVGKKLVVDETVKIKSNLSDDESGLSSQDPWVNGRLAPNTFWDGPWSGGIFEAKVVASDRAGNVAETSPLSFEVDAEPPTIEWALLSGRGDSNGAKRHNRWASQGLRWLEWSVDGEKWKPLVWGDRDSSIHKYIDGLRRFDLRPSQLVGFEVTSSQPQVLFRAPGGQVFLESESIDLGQERVLKVFADDLVAGVNLLRVWIENPRGDSPRLAVEASDYFGHKKLVGWDLVRQN